MASRTRPPHDYLPDEWVEWRQFPLIMIKALSKMSTTVMEDLSWSDMLKHNTKVTTTSDEAFRIGTTLPTSQIRHCCGTPRALPTPSAVTIDQPARSETKTSTKGYQAQGKNRATAHRELGRTCLTLLTSTITS